MSNPEIQIAPMPNIEISDQDIKDVLRHFAKRPIISSDSEKEEIEEGSESPSNQSQSEDQEETEQAEVKIEFEAKFKEMSIAASNLAKKAALGKKASQAQKAILKAIERPNCKGFVVNLNLNKSVKTFLYITFILNFLQKVILFASRSTTRNGDWYWGYGYDSSYGLKRMCYVVICFMILPILLRRCKKSICKFWCIGLALYIIESFMLAHLFDYALHVSYYSKLRIVIAIPFYLGTLAIDVALILNLIVFRKKLNSTIVFLTTFLSLIVLCVLLLRSLYASDTSDISWHDYLLSLAAIGFVCSPVAAVHVLIFKERLCDAENPIKAGDCFYFALAGKLDALLKLPLLALSKVGISGKKNTAKRTLA